MTRRTARISPRLDKLASRPRQPTGARLQGHCRAPVPLLHASGARAFCNEVIFWFFRFGFRTTLPYLSCDASPFQPPFRYKRQPLPHPVEPTKVSTLRRVRMATDMAKEGVSSTYPPFSQQPPSHFRHLHSLAGLLPCSALAMGGLDEYFSTETALGDSAPAH